MVCDPPVHVVKSFCLGFSFISVVLKLFSAPLCFGLAPAGVQSISGIVIDGFSCSTASAAGPFGYPGRLAGIHQIFRGFGSTTFCDFPWYDRNFPGLVIA